MTSWPNNLPLAIKTTLARSCEAEQGLAFCRCGVERKTDRLCRVKDGEIIADNLKQAGWSCSCISSTDHKGRQLWVVAAERESAGRFIVHADEMAKQVAALRILS
jgi:sugar lactone lactonase YvrE